MNPYRTISINRLPIDNIRIDDTKYNIDATLTVKTYYFDNFSKREFVLRNISINFNNSTPRDLFSKISLSGNSLKQVFIETDKTLDIGPIGFSCTVSDRLNIQDKRIDLINICSLDEPENFILGEI